MTVPEPIAPRFGRPLIVEYLFNFQAGLHQHQSKIKLSHVDQSANILTKSYIFTMAVLSLLSNTSICWILREQKQQFHASQPLSDLTQLS